METTMTSDDPSVVLATLLGYHTSTLQRPWGDELVVSCPPTGRPSVPGYALVRESWGYGTPDFIADANALRWAVDQVLTDERWGDGEIRLATSWSRRAGMWTVELSSDIIDPNRVVIGAADPSAAKAIVHCLILAIRVLKGEAIDTYC